MKKGQANPANYIALLIFVIGISLIVYILMLPPIDRAELLEQNRTVKGDGKKDLVTVLMTKEPGTLSNVADTEIINDLPSFTLFSRTDSSVLTEFQAIYVKKSLFEEQSRNISFSIDNPDNTDNYVLSFTTSRHSGILTIYLNGNILTSEEYSTGSPAPIRLPKDWLQKENNLQFRVSGPGIEFWKSNEYMIQNMKITADVTDRSGVENKQIFVINEQEKANLESFELKFVADCKASDVSPMQIYLNKRLIYSSIPDCNMPTKVAPQEASRIKEGENDLLFRAEKGFYDVYSVETKMILEKPLYPTYYFYLQPEKYDETQSDKADINITMYFTDDETEKKGIVLINGIKREIDDTAQDFNWKVNNYIRKGNNAVEIQPVSDKLNILELNVILVE